MPQSPFASHRRRRLHRLVRVALHGATGRALFVWLLAFSTTLGCLPLFGQTKSQALGDAAAARRRAEQFLAGRTVVAVGSRVGGAPATALARARQQHAAMLAHVRGVRPAAALANLAAPWQPLGPMTVNSLGYGPITGRITSIALDPNDPTGNSVWLGTTGGGVWKSTNAAGPLADISFAPLTDTLPVFSPNEGASTVPSLSVGAVAVQPAATAVVLAGTGDPNEATDSYYGQGILRSADGGQTWSLMDEAHNGANENTSFKGLATAGFAWSTTTPTLVVAAMTTALEGVTVGALNFSSVPGLFVSRDAGLTWTMATVYDGNQIVQTPVPLGFAQSANNATAVVWDAQRSLFIAALAAHGYYGSPDGQTWHRLSNQPGTGLTATHCPVGPNGSGSPACPIARGALSVQPSTGDLYALTVDSSGNDQGLWQDLCNAGTSGTCATSAPMFASRLDKSAFEAGEGAAGGSTEIPQGTYDLTLAATPVAGGGTLLFAGAIDLYRCALSSGATSCTWRNTTNAGNGCNAPALVAPAQHALAATTLAAPLPVLFLGNDGGLWRSTDNVAQTGPVCAATDSSHFDNLNPAIGKGGSLAEVVGFAEDPSSPDTLIAGMGANGSAASTNATTLPAWPQLSAGEGGYPQIDGVTPNNWYVATGAGVNLNFCGLGGTCAPSNFLGAATVGEPEVGNDASLLDATTLLDPQAPTSLLTATCRVWRGPAQSGNAWTAANALSPAMDGGGTPCNFSSAFIRSLGAGGPAVPSMSAVPTGSTGSGVIYAGMAGALDGGGSLAGHIFVTKSANIANSTTPWTDVATGPVVNSTLPFNGLGFDISSAVVDAHDPTGGTVYATVMGFGETGAVPHVYRSLDFGAHWTDVTANLPNAPANSLVVDPNDANTVYLALDTGVYVTRGIFTCATQNCWSPLGSGLPNAPVTQLQAGVNLPTGDGRVGMLRAATYGRGLWQTPLLSAVSNEKPGLTASPTTLTFASQQVATQSSVQQVTLTSTGSSPVTISSLAMTGDFGEADTCTNQTLPVGATCTISIQFAPTATGARTGLLTVYANIAGGQVTVSLAGTASAPAAVVLTPLALTFPSTTVNQTAATEIITVSNTGQNPATLQTPSIAGDFAIKQNTCGTSLPSQTGCSLVISFTPTASGTRTGVLTISGSAGIQTAQLSGIGQSPATDTLAPLFLNFTQQLVGSTSAAQQVTITNSGDVALTLLKAVVSNGNFTATNSCSSSLAPHSTCAVSVTFVPASVGAATGTLTVSDAVRYQNVPLTGTGVAPAGISISPGNVNFEVTGVGLNSAPQTVTLTNNGGLPLTLTPPTVSGDFAIASNTCGATLPAGDACTLVIFFAPTGAGPRTGSLNLTDTAPGGKQTVNLSGTGLDFTLSPNGPTSVTVASGGSATFPIALSSFTGLNGNVTLTCSGTPANSKCTVSPPVAALGGNVQVNVIVQTGMTTASLYIPGDQPPRPEEIPLAASPVLLLLFRRWRKRARPRAKDSPFPTKRSHLLNDVVCVLALVALGSLGGCATSRLIPVAGTGSSNGAGTPTPSGTYNLTVAGTSSGITHVVNLSLTLQ